jgi:ATP-dependent Lhr-like helicase
VRARLGGGRPAHAARTPSARPRSVRTGAGLRRGALSRAGLAGAVRSATNVNLPAAAGRWSLLPRDAQLSPADQVEERTTRTAVLTAALLERHGVLVRGAAGLEDLPGGFGAAYQVLRRLEESGQVRRGYLVEGLGAAQFALPEVVDRLRADAADLASRRSAARDAPPSQYGQAAHFGQAAPFDPASPHGPASPYGQASTPRVHLLAATDPANPYGAALAWPATTAGEGHRPGRKAGAVVVLVEGDLVLYVERGGRTLLSFSEDATVLGLAAPALAERAGTGDLGPLTLHRIDGLPALEAGGPLADALRAAGFGPTPRGLRLRPVTSVTAPQRR